MERHMGGGGVPVCLVLGGDAVGGGSVAGWLAGCVVGREDEKEKEKEARKLYEGFVRRKDETRIRLPVSADAKVGRSDNMGRGVLSVSI